MINADTVKVHGLLYLPAAKYVFFDDSTGKYVIQKVR
jgi:hypothetical protein